MSTASFDERAATYDASPVRQALAQAIVQAMRHRLPLAPGLRLVELGCGTGLVGLPLAAITGAYLGLDLSTGMIGRCREKLAALALADGRAEVRDLVAEPLPPACCDVAVSAMAFHHLDDPAAMLTALAACLVPGGWLAIADLETEDGSFHDHPVPQHGFDPPSFLAMVAQAGFTDLRHERVHAIVRPPDPRAYPVFVAWGRKSEHQIDGEHQSAPAEGPGEEHGQKR